MTGERLGTMREDGVVTAEPETGTAEPARPVIGEPPAVHDPGLHPREGAADLFAEANAAINRAEETLNEAIEALNRSHVAIREIEAGMEEHPPEATPLHPREADHEPVPKPAARTERDTEEVLLEVLIAIAAVAEALTRYLEERATLPLEHTTIEENPEEDTDDGADGVIER